MKDIIHAAQAIPNARSMIPRKSEKNGLMIAFTIRTIPSTIFPIKEIPFDKALPGENDLDLKFFFLNLDLCLFL